MGQAGEEGGEGAVVAWGCREQRPVHLAGPGADRDGLEAREVRLAVVGHGVAGAAVTSSSRRVTVPKGSLERICTGMRRASSVIQSWASARGANTPSSPTTGLRMRHCTLLPSGSSIFSRFTTLMVTGVSSL